MSPKVFQIQNCFSIKSSEVLYSGKFYCKNAIYFVTYPTRLLVSTYLFQFNSPNHEVAVCLFFSIPPLDIISVNVVFLGERLSVQTTHDDFAFWFDVHPQNK